MVEIAQRRVGVGPGDPVGGQPHVHLELAQRHLGVGAEDAVVVAHLEAERAEHLLQRQHVRSVNMRHTQIKRAIAELVGGRDELGPQLVVDPFAFGQIVVDREPPKRGGRRLVEGPGQTRFIQQPQLAKPALHIPHRGTGSAKTDRFHRHYCNRFTNQSAIDSSRSRAGDGTTRSIRRFLAIDVRFSA